MGQSFKKHENPAFENAHLMKLKYSLPRSDKNRDMKIKNLGMKDKERTSVKGKEISTVKERRAVNGHNGAGVENKNELIIDKARNHKDVRERIMDTKMNGVINLEERTHLLTDTVKMRNKRGREKVGAVLVVTLSCRIIRISLHACTDPESFARGGPTLTTFFLSDNDH